MPQSITDSRSGSRYRKAVVEEEDVTAKVVGDFGRWQLKISVLMSLLKLSNAWFQLNIIFMAPAQQFWCAKPSFLNYISDKEWRDISVPVSYLI